MCKKLICLISFVLVLGLALTSVVEAAADPNLVAWWKLDEGMGVTVLDSSGRGNGGTLANGPQWVPGNDGGALYFDGTDDYVDLGTPSELYLPENYTYTAWFKVGVDINGDSGAQYLLCIGSRSDLVFGEEDGVGINGDLSLHYYDSATTFHAVGIGQTVWSSDEWHMVAGTKDSATGHKIYLDGELKNSDTNTNDDNHATSRIISIGAMGWNTDEYFNGTIDDVRIYNRVLTQEEIQEVMIVVPPGSPYDPSPANKATDVPRDVTLSWTPGEFAAPVNGHKVYLSDNFNDVNDATDGITQDANSYARPQRLDFNTTYYWRVDEVNAPPTTHIEFKGRVWQFTTEPIAYPIDGNNITATSSSTHQTDTGTENTINGSGLDVNDLHSTESADMWLSGEEPNGAWIEYELDKVYKLHQMWAWNANQMVEPMIGFGLKDVTIEYSTNGTDYATLGTTHEFARAPGADGYAHNTTVDFGGAAAKYIRFTANSNWGGMLKQYGLSEVRFFYIPVFAREPSPDSGTTDVDVDVNLGFRAGREAAKHDVYLNSDEQAVIDGNAPVTTVTETSYGPLSLDLDTTYYWKINEVNDAETTTTWQGDIWNFTTHEFLVVDDFEDYNDYPPNEIWSTWIDGYGILTNGATSGHPAPDFLAGEHYVETTTVHGGSQAMPLFYSNTGGATYSEATANVADLQVGQDWTKGAPETLVLWIHGDLSNAAADQLYVKINDTKVMYDGDLSVPIWKQWNVDLASLGINLSNITTLSIGVDGGGSGMLYVDDIALYRTAPPVVVAEPLDPPPGGIKGLVAYWKLDEASGLTAADSSGYGNDGTLMNMAGTEWTAGFVDGALRFDGNDQYVDFGSDESLWLTGEATISAWVKMEPANEDAYMGIAGKIVVDPSYNGFSLVRHSSNVFRMWVGHDGALENVSSDVTYNDTDWHHVVGVCQGGINHLYVDGVKQAGEAAVELGFSRDYALIGKQYSDRDYRYWVGTIDDVRIYYRALSEQEISGL